MTHISPGVYVISYLCYFSCSTSDGYVQCNLASCCPQISPGVYGSKSNKGCAVFVCFFFCFQTSTWADNLFNVSLQVVIGSEDLAANHDVMQIIEVLDDRTRDSRLLALLDKYHQAQR